MGVAYTFTFPVAILASTVITKERDLLDIGAFRLLAVAAFVVATSTFTIFRVAAILRAIWLIIATVGRTCAFFTSACAEEISVPWKGN